MILVTGASGQLGAAVVEALLKKGVEPSNIAILSRDKNKVAQFEEQGVIVRQGNYDNYDSLIKAFQGIEKLYFVSGNDIENRTVQHQNVIKAAKMAGIKQVVYTSTQRKTDTKDSVISFVAESHITTEELLKASGLTYTILKHNLYLEVLPLFIGNPLETGVVYLPTENGKVAFASRLDMAEGGAIILTSSGHDNKVYEFGGDESLNMETVAKTLSTLLDKEITYVSPPADDFIKTLQEAGVPKPLIDLTLGFSTGIAQNEFDLPNPTLKELLGRDLISLSAVLESTYVAV